MDKQNLQEILDQHHLKVVPASFDGTDKTRAHVKLVLNTKGEELILKTDKIEEYQIDLLEIADQLKDKISFSVPQIIARGSNYLLLEKVSGKPLQEFYSEPEWCIELLKKLNDDYQILLKELLEVGATPDDKLTSGRSWLTSRMYTWAKNIITAKLLSPDNISHLQGIINAFIESRGADFFGWSHANIHGEHVIISEDKKPYLLDLTIQPRPGNGYYDFLRSLDHFFLMSKDDPEKLFDTINTAITTHLSKKDKHEVHVIFAFRCIGVLGQDILNNPRYKDDPDMLAKIPYLLKWIKMDY